MSIGAIDKEATERSAAEIDPLKMPIPKGYKILITLPKVEKQLGESGLILADSTQRQEELASCLGFVLKLGDMAFKDEHKFPTGPW